MRLPAPPPVYWWGSFPHSGSAGVALAAAGLGPVFDLEILEVCEVSCIDCDECQAAGMSDRGDLTIDARGRATEISKRARSRPCHAAAAS